MKARMKHTTHKGGGHMPTTDPAKHEKALENLRAAFECGEKAIVAADSPDPDKAYDYAKRAMHSARVALENGAGVGWREDGIAGISCCYGGFIAGLAYSFGLKAAQEELSKSYSDAYGGKKIPPELLLLTCLRILPQEFVEQLAGQILSGDFFEPGDPRGITIEQLRNVPGGMN